MDRFSSIDSRCCRPACMGIRSSSSSQQQLSWARLNATSRPITPRQSRWIPHSSSLAGGSASRGPNSCSTAAHAAAASGADYSSEGILGSNKQQQQTQPAAADQQGTQQQERQQQQEGQQKPSRWQAVQGLLTQYGPGAFFSYITFCNIVSVTMLSSAWLIFTRTTGFTPLQQWPKFIVFYAGAYALQHIARPWKLAVGLAGTPVGSAFVNGMARVLGSSQNYALAAMLVVEAAALLCCLGSVAIYANGLAAAAAAAVVAPG